MPSYPLSMPATPAFTQSRFEMKRVTAVTTSPFSGVQQAYEHPSALWAGTFTLPAMKREQAASWLAFFMKLHGRTGTFLLGDPDAKNGRGSITGNVTIDGPNDAGSNTLNLSTSVISESEVFKENDYIQIGSGADSKLYMIVADADTDENGDVTVEIEPALRSFAPNGEEVVYTEPKGLFRMDSPDLGWDANRVSIYGITFSCTEAL